jgi:hypothetical protein
MREQITGNVATTNQNGLFEMLFAMNWTGWLPLTVAYYGSGQYRGLEQKFSLTGEST